MLYNIVMGSFPIIFCYYFAYKLQNMTNISAKHLDKILNILVLKRSESLYNLDGRIDLNKRSIYVLKEKGFVSIIENETNDNCFIIITKDGERWLNSGGFMSELKEKWIKRAKKVFWAILSASITTAIGFLFKILIDQ